MRIWGVAPMVITPGRMNPHDGTDFGGVRGEWRHSPVQKGTAASIGYRYRTSEDPSFHEFPTIIAAQTGWARMASSLGRCGHDRHARVPRPPRAHSDRRR